MADDRSAPDESCPSLHLFMVSQNQTTSLYLHPPPPPPTLTLYLLFPSSFSFRGFCFLSTPHPHQCPPPHPIWRKEMRRRQKLGGKEGRNALSLTDPFRASFWVGGWGACVSSLCQRNKSLKKLQKLRLGLFFFLPPELRNDPTVCLLSEGSDPIRTPPPKGPQRESALCSLSVGDVKPDFLLSLLFVVR